MAVDERLNELLADGFTEEEKASILSGEDHPVEPAPTEEVPEQPAPLAEPTEEITEENPPEDTEEIAPETAAKKKPKWLMRVDEEKAKRKQAETDLAALREKWTLAEKRVAEIAKLAEGEKPAEKKPSLPDPNVDPFGHLAARLDMTSEALTELFKEAEARKKAEAERRREQEEFSQWQREFDDYRKTTPDLIESMNYLADQRRAELAIFHDPATIDQILQNEGSQIIQLAHSKGQNPAEFFYQAAKIRGYQANGKDAPAPDQPDEKSLKRIAEGQKKAQVLSSGSESEAKGLTLDNLLDMSNEDYEKLLKTKYGDNFTKLRKAIGV